MRVCVVVLGLLLSALAGGAAAGATLDGYKGPDAGHAIFAMAVANMPSTNLRFHLRRVGDAEADPIQVTGDVKFLGKVLSKSDGMSDAYDPVTMSRLDRAGLHVAFGQNYLKVLVFDLAPGQYQIDDIQANDCPSMYCLTEFFKSPPIRFEVKPGRSTYLGRLSVVGVGRLNWLTHHGYVFYRWVLSLNDQSGQDLPIAAGHVSDLGPVDHAALLGTIDRLQPMPSGAPSDDPAVAAPNAPADPAVATEHK
ncbi:MAG TPA: hypothetical protein VGG29_06010 [Caulobacteraceae bacterium]|jgi:hypothetical protein